LDFDIALKGIFMFVYLKKDVEKVGMAGQVVEVADGFAVNFLIAKKLGVQVGEKERNAVQFREKQRVVQAAVINSKIAMVAERIKGIHLTIKKRVNEKGEPYSAVGADEIVDLLKAKEIKITKKQVDFPKAIRTLGEHKVVIKLTSKLQPECLVKVVAQ
jgi:large subunit ribosomal protein L9